MPIEIPINLDESYRKCFDVLNDILILWDDQDICTIVFRENSNRKTETSLIGLFESDNEFIMACYLANFRLIIVTNQQFYFFTIQENGSLKKLNHRNHFFIAPRRIRRNVRFFNDAVKYVSGFIDGNKALGHSEPGWHSDFSIIHEKNKTIKNFYIRIKDKYMLYFDGFRIEILSINIEKCEIYSVFNFTFPYIVKEAYYDQKINIITILAGGKNIDKVIQCDLQGNILSEINVFNAEDMGFLSERKEIEPVIFANKIKWIITLGKNQIRKNGINSEKESKLLRGSFIHNDFFGDPIKSIGSFYGYKIYPFKPYSYVAHQALDKLSDNFFTPLGISFQRDNYFPQILQFVIKIFRFCYCGFKNNFLTIYCALFKDSFSDWDFFAKKSKSLYFLKDYDYEGLDLSGIIIEEMKDRDWFELWQYGAILDKKQLKQARKFERRHTKGKFVPKSHLNNKER